MTIFSPYKTFKVKKCEYSHKIELQFMNKIIKNKEDFIKCYYNNLKRTNKDYSFKCLIRCPNSGSIILKPNFTAFGEPGREIINFPL